MGQRLEQDAVDHAEDRGVGADAERKGDDGDHGEQGLMAQRTQRVAKVLSQHAQSLRAAHPAEPPLVGGSTHAPKMVEIAEAPERFEPRRLRRHAAGDQLLDDFFEMKAELLLDVGFDVGAKEAEIAPPERRSAHR